MKNQHEEEGMSIQDFDIPKVLELVQDLSQRLKQKEQVQTLVKQVFEQSTGLTEKNPDYWHLFDKWAHVRIEALIQSGIIEPENLY